MRQKSGIPQGPEILQFGEYSLQIRRIIAIFSAVHLYPIVALYRRHKSHRKDFHGAVQEGRYSYRKASRLNENLSTGSRNYVTAKNYTFLALSLHKSTSPMRCHVPISKQGLFPHHHQYLRVDTIYLTSAPGTHHQSRGNNLKVISFSPVLSPKQS